MRLKFIIFVLTYFKKNSYFNDLIIDYLAFLVDTDEEELVELTNVLVIAVVSPPNVCQLEIVKCPLVI